MTSTAFRHRGLMSGAVFRAWRAPPAIRRRGNCLPRQLIAGSVGLVGFFEANFLLSYALYDSKDIPILKARVEVSVSLSLSPSPRTSFSLSQDDGIHDQLVFVD